MSFKDFLVVVDSSQHCRQRVTLAAALARQFEAQLTGLYAEPAAGVSPFVADQYAPEALEAAQSLATRRREDAAALFAEATRATSLEGEWRETRGDAAEIAIWHGRHADLTILGQLDPAESTFETGAVAPERVVMESGRPSLILPYGSKAATVGTHVLIAWNASPQAARAVGDALPLLRAAKTVTILTVDPFTVLTAPGDEGERSESVLRRHLARHGVAAELRGVPHGDLDPANTLLSSAADAGADLIVMGMFGHSRLRELVFGGVSKSVLGHMTAPLLVAH